MSFARKVVPLSFLAFALACRVGGAPPPPTTASAEPPIGPTPPRSPEPEQEHLSLASEFEAGDLVVVWPPAECTEVDRAAIEFTHVVVDGESGEWYGAALVRRGLRDALFGDVYGCFTALRSEDPELRGEVAFRVGLRSGQLVPADAQVDTDVDSLGECVRAAITSNVTVDVGLDGPSAAIVSGTIQFAPYRGRDCVQQFSASRG